ncbi:hypothetical protein [Miltoncostaea marina]|uniref:hypothetical protein n=1 Tax=Miltoncostaea marina TaxID=2843215 RepID=UPI001C3DBDAA|nr:hypothetical protein [Miltoncostaea marina]
MTTARTRRTAGASLVAIAAGAALAAGPAAGATAGLAGGSTALHLDRGTAAALSAAGIGLAPLGPAAADGARVTFPVSGGAIDPATAAGRIAHRGGLAFSHGGTTVLVRDFVVRTDRRSPVLIARAGAARLPLLDLDTSDARVLRRGAGGAGTWVVRVEATLRPEAARALNAAFGTHLPAGLRMGRIDVRTSPAQLLLRGGATTLALDPGTAAALASLGVAPSAVAPGRAAAGGLAFPVTGGRVAAGSFAGTIDHSGGIALTAGATRVELTRFRIAVSGSPTLTARVGDGDARVALTVDLGAARTGVSRRTAVVRGARVSLSAGAAAALNQAFGTTALTAGTPLGVADVRARVR